MTEDEAFLGAILSTPDDETARLAYADCLQDRNDPRGEWLRLDVQIERLAGEGRTDDALAHRRRELEAVIEPTWLAVVSPVWGMRRWQILYDDLDITEYPDCTPLAKPTDEALDEFEVRARFRLPLSYRAFIKVFGPGELAFAFEFPAPGYPQQPGEADLWELNDTLRWRLFEAPGHPPHVPELLHRVVFFASGYGGLYGWNPDEVTDERRQEYRIFRTTGPPEAAPFERIADSFVQFIEEVCLGPENLQIPGWDYEEFGTRRAFVPRVDLSR